MTAQHFTLETQNQSTNALSHALTTLMLTPRKLHVFLIHVAFTKSCWLMVPVVNVLKLACQLNQLYHLPNWPSSTHPSHQIGAAHGDQTCSQLTRLLLMMSALCPTPNQEEVTGGWPHSRPEHRMFQKLESPTEQTAAVTDSLDTKFGLETRNAEFFQTLLQKDKSTLFNVLTLKEIQHLSKETMFK